ncbi:TPA: hypothetical protein ACNV18_000847 [Pseudomonas putida]|nr:hypothetical protein [Pseudomonas aeruginosa]
MNLKHIKNTPDYLYALGYIIHNSFKNNIHKFTALDEAGNQVKAESPDYAQALSDLKLNVTLIELNKQSITPAKLLAVGLGNTTDGKSYIQKALGLKGQFIMSRVESTLKNHLLKKSESLDPESSNPVVAAKGCTIVRFIKEYHEKFGKPETVNAIDDFLNGKEKFKNLPNEVLDLYATSVDQYMEVLRKEKTQYLVKDTKPTLRIVK